MLHLLVQDDGTNLEQSPHQFRRLLPVNQTHIITYTNVHQQEPQHRERR
jgi:hypothetical protein